MYFACICPHSQISFKISHHGNLAHVNWPFKNIPLEQQLWAVGGGWFSFGGNTININGAIPIGPSHKRCSGLKQGSTVNTFLKI